MCQLGFLAFGAVSPLGKRGNPLTPFAQVATFISLRLLRGKKRGSSSVKARAKAKAGNFRSARRRGRSALCRFSDSALAFGEAEQQGRTGKIDHGVDAQLLQDVCAVNLNPFRA
jgi:hypothetical protein